MTTIDTASLTPLTILQAAQRAGLRLMPGRNFHVNAEDRVVGCCALTALAIEIDPKIVTSRTGVFDVLRRAGLPGWFRSGVLAGFDGVPLCKVPDHHGDDYDRGYALGRATRLAAGIDGTGATP